jgi:hypothetical protein
MEYSKLPPDVRRKIEGGTVEDAIVALADHIKASTLSDESSSELQTKVSISSRRALIKKIKFRIPKAKLTNS